MGPLSATASAIADDRNRVMLCGLRLTLYMTSTAALHIFVLSRFLHQLSGYAQTGRALWEMVHLQESRSAVPKSAMQS